MEQGTIVALVALGGSAFTVLVTGAVSIWTKKIEAKQKLREHQLSIRSTYVNKKIEAGADFVSKTTMRINTLYLATVFFKLLYERKQFNKEYYDAINKGREKQREININNAIPIHLFFDVLHLNDKANELIHTINSKQAKVADYLKSEGSLELTDEIEKAAKEMHELNEQLVKIYQQMNIFVRTEVAKYDIL